MDVILDIVQEKPVVRVNPLVVANHRVEVGVTSAYHDNVLTWIDTHTDYRAKTIVRRAIEIRNINIKHERNSNSIGIYMDRVAEYVPCGVA